MQDDLDGREADIAVTFGIDGVLYRIRLSVEHAADLYDLFAPLRDRAERVGLVQLPEPEISLPTVEFPSRRAYGEAVRDWVAARGIDLPTKGNLPRAAASAFDLERALEERESRE